MKLCDLISLSVVVILLTSCSKHHPAPVKDFSRNSVINSSQPISKQKKYTPKYMTVKKGDTLYSIGFSKSIDYKYLAQINGIKPPFNIYPGQKLRLQANKSLVNNVSTHPINTKKTKTTPIIIKKPLVSINASANQPVIAKNTPKPKTINKPPVIHKTGKNTPTTNSKPIRPNQPVAQSNSKWIWPLKGKVISTFLLSDISRKGIDISAKLNSSVVASQNGTVVYSGDGLRGYGELIIIKHSNNLLSAYAHNSSRLVKEGVTVKQGQIIAKSGKGTDGLSLLHFEIRKNGQPVNPLKYLPK